MAADPLLLSQLSLHTIALVTTVRPSPAVTLAARANPAARVLVLAPPSFRSRVEQLGGTWANMNMHINATQRFDALYRHAAADRPEIRSYMLRRWLLLAEELRLQRLPSELPSVGSIICGGLIHVGFLAQTSGAPASCGS